MRRYSLSVLTVSILFSSLTNSKDYYMSVGGGYSPSGAQGVLELNMKNFSKKLSSLAADNSIVQLYGGGCQKESLDVYVKAKDFTFEDLLFTTFFEGNSDSECVWRHNELEHLDGASTKDNVEYFLADQIRRTRKNDNFRFYFTGHGSKKSREDKDDESQMDLWGVESAMLASEFVSELDKLPVEAHTQVLMVQCFSGGFTKMNFEGGETTNKLSSHNRCGFFSQLPDRLAAGCTPDLEKREEYSRYFMEAYNGMTEKAEAISADYNKDGVVGANEAHAYVVKNEKSIDVPITTSSWFLRQKEIKIHHNLEKATLKRVLSLMTDLERSVFASLISTTGLEIQESDRLFMKIKTAIKKEKEFKEKAESAATKAQDYLDSIFKEIKFYLKERYPVFYSSYGITHGSAKVMSSEMALKAKESMLKHPKYELFKNAYKARDAATEVEEVWERRVVQLERLEYLVETKLMELSLEKVSDDLKKRYKELQDCESRPFFAVK